MSKHLFDPNRAIETELAHAGRDPHDQYGFVNPPVVRGSTVEFPDLDTLDRRNQRYGYGRIGNPTTDALQDLITGLEQGAGTVLAPSGLAAIAMALMSVVAAGDEILIVDCAYEPTRKFAEGVLKRLGVTARYFDPRVGADIDALLSDKTKAVFLESPGSLTLEVQDLPAISAACRKRQIAVLIDNTWATPLFHKPLTLGADIVIHSATKYFSGHSDVSLGAVTANEAYFERVKTNNLLFGTCASPDDAFLVLRGLRSLKGRMDIHSASALKIARWLSERDDVVDVLHPALVTHPDHALYMRDFSGSGSVFSFELPPASRSAVAKLTDDMDYFHLGYSYGGYESLMIAPNPATMRSAVSYARGGNLIRIHVGTENVDDLIGDLDAGLARYNRARN